MNLQVTTSATKTDLIQLAEKTVNEISEFGKPIETVEILSRMEFLIDQIKKNKDFIEIVRNELEKDGKVITTPTGTKIELVEAGTKYNYQDSNDPEWIELNQKFQEIKAKMSERETFLKTIPQEGVPHISKEGELIQIYRPTKTSTSTFKTTLAK
jgi:hypothetical protein